MVFVCINVLSNQLNFLKKLGAISLETKSPYEIIRYSYTNSTWILYNSKKLVINAPSTLEEELKILCKKNNLTIQTTTSSPQSSLDNRSSSSLDNAPPSPQLENAIIIGSDETLKGDTFGGLIVCSAMLSLQEQKDLEQYSFTDSKKYTDNEIMILAKELLKKYPNNFETIILTPKKYNQLQTIQPLTKTLNALHKETAFKLEQKITSSLKPSTEKKLSSISKKIIHVVDKFPGCDVGDIQVTQAESKYLSVALASIVARYYALLQFQELSQLAGFKLPMGSTHVQNALGILKEKKLSFSDFVKLHFKNVKPYL
jgi:ribonuclease HIII